MKTRFAPSPTGFLHLGSVRTALFAWLMARHHQGTFLLRIEDTDQVRSRPEYTDLIIHTMEWLGLDWDGEIEYQSKRYDRYNAVIDELVAKDLAYYCDCSPERLEGMRQLQKDAGETHTYYDGHCRDKKLAPTAASVVRLKIPQDIDVSFNDEIHGFQFRERSLLDDWILRRSDGNPTYNFAVVVDDYDMSITHVIRGDDHLNNTSKQAVLYRMLNWDIPLFYHIPMILDETGARLSKRSGSANILHYRDEGYLPEALLNALARLGWSCGDRELFTIQELIDLFDGRSLQASPAAFNREKFYWIAKQWMQKLPLSVLEKKSIKEGFLDDNPLTLKKLTLTHKKAKNFQEVRDATGFFDRYQPDSVYQRVVDQTQANVLDFLQAFISEQKAKQSDLVTFFSDLKTTLKEQQLTMKDIAFPLRDLITGDPQWGDLQALLQELSLDRMYEHYENFQKFYEKNSFSKNSL